MEIVKRNIYEKDFFKWTKSQVSLLKKRNLDELDIDNLIEEIESLGGRDKRELKSHVIRLLMHLLKMKYQSEKQLDSNFLDHLLNYSKREVQLIIEQSPSLRNELKKSYEKSYEKARKEASSDTGLNINKFPIKNPWSLEDLFPEICKKIKVNNGNS